MITPSDQPLLNLDQRGKLAVIAPAWERCLKLAATFEFAGNSGLRSLLESLAPKIPATIERVFRSNPDLLEGTFRASSDATLALIDALMDGRAPQDIAPLFSGELTGMLKGVYIQAFDSKS